MSPATIALFFERQPDCEVLHTDFRIAKVTVGAMGGYAVHQGALDQRDPRHRRFPEGEVGCQVKQDPNEAAICRSSSRKARLRWKICTPHSMKPSGLS